MAPRRPPHARAVPARRARCRRARSARAVGIRRPLIAPPVPAPPSPFARPAQVPINFFVTFDQLVQTAAHYWKIDPNQYVVADQSGIHFIRDMVRKQPPPAAHARPRPPRLRSAPLAARSARAVDRVVGRIAKAHRRAARGAARRSCARSSPPSRRRAAPRPASSLPSPCAPHLPSLLPRSPGPPDGPPSPSRWTT